MNKIVLASFLTVAVVTGDQERVLCGRLSEHHNMGGWVIDVYASRERQCAGREDDYSRIVSSMYNFWDTGNDNKVSSLQVFPGCWMDTYCGSGFHYHMMTFHGWYYTNFVRSWNDCISSYKCYCGRDKQPERRRLSDVSESGVQLPEQAFEMASNTDGPTGKDLRDKCAVEQDIVRRCTDTCKTCSECLSVALLPGQKNNFEKKTHCEGICGSCYMDCTEYFVCDKFGRRSQETMYEDTHLALANIAQKRN